MQAYIQGSVQPAVVFAFFVSPLNSAVSATISHSQLNHCYWTDVMIMII